MHQSTGVTYRWRDLLQRDILHMSDCSPAISGWQKCKNNGPQCDCSDHNVEPGSTSGAGNTAGPQGGLAENELGNLSAASDLVRAQHHTCASNPHRVHDEGFSSLQSRWSPLQLTRTFPDVQTTTNVIGQLLCQTSSWVLWEHGDMREYEHFLFHQSTADVWVHCVACCYSLLAFLKSWNSGDDSESFINVDRPPVCPPIWN